MNENERFCNFKQFNFPGMQGFFKLHNKNGISHIKTNAKTLK